MPYTSLPAVVSGQTIASSWGNLVDSNLDFLANPPACRVYNTAAQSLTTATITALAFNSERYDTAGMHDTVTNNSRITFSTAGLYLLTGHVQFAVHATGLRGLFLFINGISTRIASEFRAPTTGDFTEMSISTVYKFAAGDYAQLAGYHTAGVGLNVNGSNNYSPEFTATWVGIG